MANDGLRFREHPGGGLGGSLAVEATLVADDGREHVRRETIALAARTRGEAASPTSYQVFTLRLPGVPTCAGCGSTRPCSSPAPPSRERARCAPPA
ncbi:MAG: hypothetical protein IPI34_01350 [bacterium]|nr:hypothetical protein [bacterium]